MRLTPTQHKVILAITNRFRDVDGVRFSLNECGKYAALAIHFTPITNSALSWAGLYDAQVTVGPKGGLRMLGCRAFGTKTEDEKRSIARYSPDVLLSTMASSVKITSDVCRKKN